MEILAETAPTTVNSLLLRFWLEEGFYITSLGLVFILVHRLASAKSGKPYAPCKPLAACEPEPAPKSAPCGACGPVVRTPPRTSAELPGVTDRRFPGRIVSYSVDDGYGFIACTELWLCFQRDVFLHKCQIQSFRVGTTVSFGVFLNKNGHPQAKDLEHMPMEFLDPFTARQPLNPHADPFQVSPAGKPSGKLLVPSGEFMASRWQWLSTWKGRGTKKPWTTTGKSYYDSAGSGGRQWAPKITIDDTAATWSEHQYTKKPWTFPGKRDHDSKGSCKNQWVPKVKADGIATGTHGKG